MRLETATWLWVGFIAAALGIALVYLWHRRRRSALESLGSSGMLERLTRIEHQLDSLESSVRRLAEVVDFDRQLKKGRPED